MENEKILEAEKEAQEEDKRFDSFVMSFAITEERR